MTVSEFNQLYVFDHDKLRKEVKYLLKKSGLFYKDIAASLGYTYSSLNMYMSGFSDSRFIAGALITKFKLDINDYKKEEAMITNTYEKAAQIINTPIEDVIYAINSNEDLKTLSQAKSYISDVRSGIKEELDRANNENEGHYVDPYVKEMYEWAVERLDDAWKKVDTVFTKMLKDYMKGENNGRTEK